MGFASRLGGIVAIGLFLLTVVSVATAQYSGGTGDPNAPYQIATAADLIALGEDPNDYDKHFILTADIDLSDYDGKDGRPAFQVIGDCYTSSNGITTYVKGTPFAGIFDGNGKTIFHLTSLQANGNLLGLFGGLAQGAEVKNLRVLADIDMDAMDSVVGTLAGYNGGTVTQCSSGGVVTGKGWMTVGGMVGLNMAGTITDCHSDALVSGGRGVGGLVGWNCHWQGDGVRLRGLVARCYSAGRVSGALYVGGLVGYNGGETVGCFWDMQTSGQTTSPGETGKTTAEMQTAQTFLDAGWDFVGETANGTEDIWKIAEGTGYPRLSWEKYSGGSGTADDPYQIATAADLIALGEDPSDYDKHFILTADIDLDPNLPGGKVFDKAVIAPGLFSWSRVSPYEVGRSGTPFAGVLDGNGHTIWHFTVRIEQAKTGETVLVGLLGMLRGEIRNLGVADVNITGSGCPVGGLVADNEGVVAQCYGSGVVNGTGHVGGLVGVNYGSVALCHTMGSINGNSRIGGLVGVNGSWGTPGGIVARCYSTGVVSGGAELGGLVGENGGIVTECYSSGVVSGADTVGGLVGRNWMGVELVMRGNVERSHSSAIVEGTDFAGGLVGENGGGVIECYSVGVVNGKNCAGGLVGSTLSFGSVTTDSCFWDTLTSGQATSDGGIGKTTAEMQTAATFLEARWDFVDETANGTEDVWWIEEGQDYPRLWWEPRPAVRLPVIELDATTFDAGIAEGVVLVDFFATWCSHCTTQAPILEEVADRLEGKAQVAKLDIDKARNIAQQYGVTAVPTLILFRDGVEVQRFVGVTDADVLVKAILAVVDSM
jgi:thioredoxin